jgi:glycerate 2-kinase
VIRPARQRAYLVAPDSFKGTLSAFEVAEAMERGLRAGEAAAEICPLADGGEGTMDVLLGALGGERVTAAVTDPLGREVQAAYGSLNDGRAVIDVAQASGLALVAEDERDPERASSYGTGQLIAAAIARGARDVIVAAGGSATVDGGARAVAAIREAGGLDGTALTVWCDVRTAWEDAARVFGPQKGASPEAVERLAARLDGLADRMPRDPRGVAMTGAAGGLAGGLWAELGAELRPGAAAVLDAVGFDRRLADADAVVSGEGRLDAQTLEGKCVAEVAGRCRAAGKPLHLIVGTASGEHVGQWLGAASVSEAPTLETIQAAAHRVSDFSASG